jgi:hypothetical protein
MGKRVGRASVALAGSHDTGYPPYLFAQNLRIIGLRLVLLCAADTRKPRGGRGCAGFDLHIQCSKTEVINRQRGCLLD